jgi:NAD(P)-dependent dehydrogenase (short-subunit alcohol dehydrogenase family)
VPIELIDPEVARQLFETNTLGTLATIQAVLPAFRERRSGTIINVTSSATFKPLPLVSVYRASKAAVNALTESLAVEVEPFGVRVHIVLPGMAPETSFGENAMPHLRGLDNPDYKPLIEGMLARFREPAGPVTHSRDVAEAVWLAATDPNAPLRIAAGEDAVQWMSDQTPWRVAFSGARPATFDTVAGGLIAGAAALSVTDRVSVRNSAVNLDQVLEDQPTPGVAASFNEWSALRKPAEFYRCEAEPLRERPDLRCGTLVIARQEHDPPAAVHGRIPAEHARAQMVEALDQPCPDERLRNDPGGRLISQFLRRNAVGVGHVHDGLPLPIGESLRDIRVCPEADGQEKGIRLDGVRQSPGKDPGADRGRFGREALGVARGRDGDLDAASGERFGQRLADLAEADDCVAHVMFLAGWDGAPGRARWVRVAPGRRRRRPRWRS